MKNVILEVCANSVDSALAAQEGGAHRIELCDNLYEGGTTPSTGAIETAREQLSIDIYVMIRPRGGDFCYSDLELDIMLRDIRRCKETGVDGIVVGILQPDGHIDKAGSKILIDAARPLGITFHRAFDMTIDPWKALDDLVELGVDRILTSGQKNKAIEGIDLIADLIKQASGKIGIMPGSGINETNIGEIRNKTGANEFHVSCRKTVQSEMKYRKPNIFMGGLPNIPEYEKSVTDEERIKQLVELMK